MEFEKITEKIIGSAYRVYNQMGFGFLESVYKKCLELEFKKLPLSAQFQQPIVVYYHGQIVGEFTADIIVEDTVIVELKSVNRVVKTHEVQLVNYLTATEKLVELIINFAPTKVEVKRKVRFLD